MSFDKSSHVTPSKRSRNKLDNEAHIYETPGAGAGVKQNVTKKEKMQLEKTVCASTIPISFRECSSCEMVADPKKKKIGEQPRKKKNQNRVEPKENREK